MIEKQVENGTFPIEECFEKKFQNTNSIPNGTTIESSLNSTTVTNTIINGTTNGTTNGTNNDSQDNNNNCIITVDNLSLPEVRTKNLGFVDTVFVWFRYIHFTIVPIIIFLVHKVTNYYCLMKPIKQYYLYRYYQQ